MKRHILPSGVNDIELDKVFYHQYQNGEREKISKVSEAITRVVNTINKPDNANTP